MATPSGHQHHTSPVPTASTTRRPIPMPPHSHHLHQHLHHHQHGSPAAAVNAAPNNSNSLSDAVRMCQEIQLMIEIHASHLERLRAPMQDIPITSELTKQEIRILEGKMIKHFGQQLAIRGAHQGNPAAMAALKHYPSLTQWLQVVGVSSESKRAIESRVNSLEQLKEKTEPEINRLLLASTSRLSVSQRNEDFRRLTRAIQSLRRFSELAASTPILSTISTSEASKLDLHWDSWNVISSNSSQGSSSECSSPRPDSVSNSSPLQMASNSNRVPSRAVDSVASSFSSTSSATSSLPPQSPGLVLSPPLPASWSNNSVSNCMSSQQYPLGKPVSATSSFIEKKGTPPTTPPWSIFVSKSQPQKFPTTPPPNRKHSTALLTMLPSSTANPPTMGGTLSTPSGSTSKSDYPLTKSKSHECELGNRIVPSVPSSAISSISNSTSGFEGSVSTISEGEAYRGQHHGGRKRSTVDPGCISEDQTDSFLPSASPVPSPSPFESTESIGHSASSSILQVPKSPRTPRSMGHAIRHRFKKTLKPGKCGYCSEYMFNGLKCKECKFKCHRDCEPKVPPSCCLPEDLVDYYMRHITKEGSPILPHLRPSNYGAGTEQSKIGVNPAMRHIPPYPDSSSNTSSCNSSTPSSPAVMVTSTQPTPPHSASVYTKGTKFTFPDPPITLKLHDQPMPSMQRVTSPNPIIDSVKSYDSDKTLSGTSGSSGSAGTAYRLDSQDSTASVDDSSSTWTAGRQTSISLREWDIPYEELVLGDKIGSGRFSTVYQGNWHGDVAIKILNMENTDDDDATLEAFRLDVSTFRKTRHENLILFMGACMNPPKLAIVTSLCKGNTLYTLLHLRKDKFPINKLIIIAQQIAQGMGYLHHRGIVHKDLKTKNIFLENGRAIIADFGLVNVARRLCAHHAPISGKASHVIQRESMSIPKGWLCYLAPEIMRALRVRPDEGEDLPFTKASDVFAFGTVWYELLTGEWPWKHVPPETIIWLVGKGMEPSLANLQASKDVKDILLMCWTFKPEHRPDFTYLSESLDKIPKKRGLIRSPSHPVHLWRSAESVF